jgi:hypothetical protein
MPLTQIIYASRRKAADGAERARDWREITRTAFMFNPASNVTGCLLGGQEHFTQVLEGQTDIVDALFERISRDMRHDMLVCFSRREVRNRCFSRFSNVCLLENDVASRALARHELTTQTRLSDLSMPALLAVTMEIADAVWIAETSAVHRPASALPAKAGGLAWPEGLAADARNA